MAREYWKPVPGFEDVLIASTKGRIASVCGFLRGDGYSGISISPKHWRDHFLTAKMTHSPRRSYVLSAHRTIALTFLGEPPKGRNDVNHKDGNPRNNEVSNLEWSSRYDNLEHARRTGLHKQPLHRYTEETYRKVREMAEAGTKKSVIATELGLRMSAVWYIIEKSPRGRTRPWLKAVA